MLTSRDSREQSNADAAALRHSQEHMQLAQNRRCRLKAFWEKALANPNKPYHQHLVPKCVYAYTRCVHTAAGSAIVDTADPALNLGWTS